MKVEGFRKVSEMFFETFAKTLSNPKIWLQKKVS